MIECVQVGVRKDAGKCSAVVTGLVTGDCDNDIMTNVTTMQY